MSPYDVGAHHLPAGKTALWQPSRADESAPDPRPSFFDRVVHVATTYILHAPKWTTPTPRQTLRPAPQRDDAGTAANPRRNPPHPRM
eukprot:8427785-Pyramimonas_sp.AAC.1